MDIERLKKFEIQSKETLVILLWWIIYYLFPKKKTKVLLKTNLFIALLKYILKLKNYHKIMILVLIKKKQVAYNFEYRQYYFFHINYVEKK